MRAKGTTLRKAILPEAAGRVNGHLNVKKEL
jgi:hypothetical protein